eukprot:292594-Rhodomonas_salina.2
MPPAAPGDTPQDHQSSVKDPSKQAQEQRDIDSHDPRTWVSGADVPVTASLQILSDKLLGRALVHHCFQFKLPKEWWYNRKTKQYEAVTAVATSCKKINSNYYVDCSILSPAPSNSHAHVLQFAVGPCKGKEPWNIQKHLDHLFNKQLTLLDIGLS